MLPAIRQRAAAIAEAADEAAFYHPALNALRRAFAPDITTTAEFCRRFMVEPSFGTGVTIANMRDAKVEAVCRGCSKTFSSIAAACGCGRDAADATYRRKR